MELSVKSLQEFGAFTGAPVEKEIKWTQDGKELTATAFVRKLSYRTVVSDALQFGGEVTAGRIAACICDKDGKPIFTVEDITGNPINIPDDDDQEDTPEQKEIKNKIRDKNRQIIERGPLNYELTIALLNAIAEVNHPPKKKRLDDIDELWHELILCGIGGKTIEEAQQNISYEEFLRWAQYRRKRGSMNVGLRVEYSLAIIAQMMANRYRKENTMPFTLYDFAPYHDEPKERELTIDDLKEWK